MENNTQRGNSTSQLLDESEFLEWTRHSVIGIMAFIIIFGIPGNAICVAILSKLRTRSSTDYYVLAMVCSDLFSATVNTTCYILRYVSNIWNVLASTEFCQLHDFSLYLSNTSTTLLLAATAFDRHRRTVSTSTKDPLSATINAKRVCVGIMVSSLIYSSMFPFTVMLDSGTKTCARIEGYDTVTNALSSVLACIYLFAFTVVGVCYTRVTILLHQHHRLMSGKQTAIENFEKSLDQKGLQIQNKIMKISTVAEGKDAKRQVDEVKPEILNQIKIDEQKNNRRNIKSVNTLEKEKQMINRTTLMMFLITMIYVSTWVAYWTAAAYKAITNSPDDGVPHLITKLYMINCMTNPLFYTAMSSKYRQKAKELFFNSRNA